MPDWQIRHWGNDQILPTVPFLRQAASVHAWNRISDYLRMTALAETGGIYLDTDVDLIKPLDSLAEDDCAFLGAQETSSTSSNLFNGGVLGSPPGHWLPRTCRRLLEQLDGRKDLDCYTGPTLLTEVLRERGLDRYPTQPYAIDGVRVFPVAYFYPYHWTERFDADCITQDTYAVHRWAHSWNPANLSGNERWRARVRKLFAWIAPGISFRLAMRLLRSKAKG